MPRPSNREELLVEAEALIRRQGLGATGVQQITDAAGVPKGSFYHYFRSKDALGLEVLRRYAGRGLAGLEAALVDGSGTPGERAGRWLDAAIEAEREGGLGRGCLAGNLAAELTGDSPPALREAIDDYFRQQQKGWAELLFEAQQSGELDSGADPDDLAAILVAGWQGALVRMRAAASDRPLQQFRRWVLEGLLGGGA